MITQSDVRYVARLARLHLDDDEAQRMTGELARILEHVAKIGELDLGSVTPMAHVLDVVNVERADKPRPGLTREDALRNAPAVADDGFRVPRMSR
ncbi:MAG: Asp-tRNA(Asn)/Glu-tRNA(Gln) amidotransferase subunit GatC [Actinobacteria bacterium]|nr:Asp-tRNA(Asn)/Glu-tRNA(Gln) amidotransferase subunit GatC [Actinomycetota bacterium]